MALVRTLREVAKAGSRTFASGAFPERKVAVLGAAGALEEQGRPQGCAACPGVGSPNGQRAPLQAPKYFRTVMSLRVLKIPIICSQVASASHCRSS